MAAGAAMPDGDCVQLYNMVAAEYGLRSRLGYKQFAAPTGTPWVSSPDVRTLIPYTGSAADGSKNRLFVVNDRGISEATGNQYGSGAGASATFLVATAGLPLSGYGTACAFTTSAGHFLVYCDELNGTFVYSEATDSWTNVTEGVGAAQISGVNPANFCFVLSWKSRLWFVERNTAKAWYLAAGSIFGVATQLNLDRAAQFRQGGGLRCLANWTGDGGAGIDDRLVAMGDGGDVAIYEGTDPASADTFRLKGTWNCGALVAGRNVVSNFGGDVLLLTKSGIRPLSQLVAGGDGSGTYQTGKVANLFNSLTLARADLPNWAIHIHPEDNTLLVLVPSYLGGPTEQLAQALWNRSWSRYRDLPIVSACVWQKKLYFGDTTGTIWINTGYVDEVSLANPSDFTAVNFGVLTPFRNGNGRMKKVEFIRPTLLSEQPGVAVSANARYGYSLSELPAVQPVAASGASSWDVGTWDASAWQDDYTATQAFISAEGYGADMAIAVRGRAICRTVLVGIEVFFSQGGYL